jgi:HEAT repeat protein
MPAPSAGDTLQSPDAPDPSKPYDVAAAREFRARPNPAEAETARLTVAGLLSANTPESSLLATAKAADAGARIRALEMLAIQNTTAGRQALNQALDDPNPFVRGEAVTLLLSLGSDAEAARGVADLMTHKDPAVRFSATMALGEQSGEEAEFRLKRALNDEDRDVREMAAHLLEQKRNEQKKNEEKKNEERKKNP